MTNPTKKTYLLIGALLAAVNFHASAALVYDNSVNDLNIRFNSGTVEVGDEIVLGGPQRLLQSFEIEFYGIRNGLGTPPGPYAGSIQARVRLYRNDGPLFNGYASPGTVFYDSGTYAVGLTTERSTFVFAAGAQLPAGGLFMPVVSNMTFSVIFSGMGVGDELGLDLYSPPVVGSSKADYWENNGGWQLKQFPTGTPPVNFAARFNATSVPDATGIGIFLVSLLGLFIFSRVVQRNGSVKS